MPECTPEERELLDALKGEPMRNIEELRAKLCISRVPPELFELAVNAHRDMTRACMLRDRAWNQLNELGITGRTKAFNEFYDEIERLGAERAGR